MCTFKASPSALALVRYCVRSSTGGGGAASGCAEVRFLNNLPKKFLEFSIANTLILT